MAGLTGNPYAGNRHADVMNEHPADDAGKLRLCEEVKNRAKGAFQQKDMPSAEMLYGKAIELLSGMPDKKEPALYSNRAMVRLNLSKVEGALEDSIACLALDPAFVKAHHRKAQALLRLNEYDEAIRAAEAGQALDPANKSFDELVAKAEEEKLKDVEEKARLKRDAQDARVELHNASTARTPAVPKKREAPADGATGENTSMRGYKTTADGRKTSYFHTDISDEAKKLIEAQGFGKPKKLEEGSAAPAGDVQGGGSQWNQAGTYEEKNMLKWADKSLKEALAGVTYSHEGLSVATRDVGEVKGEATISCSRGKRRHLLDLNFSVDFEATSGDASGKGKLVFPEVSCDADDGFETQVEIDENCPPAVREIIGSFVRPAGQGLQPLVTAKLKEFVAQYQAQ